MNREFRRWRLPVLGVLTMAIVGTMLSSASGASAATPGDVWMKDNDPATMPSCPVADNGNEPNPCGNVWYSPDIVPPPILIVGGTSNINVNLRHRPRPNGGNGPVTGDLKLYWTNQGTAASWLPSTDWHLINTIPGVTVPPGGVTITVPWVNVPGPGHFCLLARFVSSADPMTFFEAPFSNTYNNTRNNNNIAWRNADTVRLQIHVPDWWTLHVRNPEPDPRVFNLVLAQPERPFVGPGRLILDLGETLAARWRQAGQPGVGVRPVGETQVEIVDPKQATIKGLLLNPDDEIDTKLGFIAGDGAKGGQFRVSMIQTDERDAPVGGVELTAAVE